MRRLKPGLWLVLGLCLSGAAQTEPLPNLAATAPKPGQNPLFAPLLGHWDYSYRFFDASGKVTEDGTGTWDFSWILDGYSMQDVQSFRASSGALSELGTTLRIPRADGSWRSIWDGPRRGNLCDLTARADAEGIVLDGNCNGTAELERWMFTHIGARRFAWHGYYSRDGGRHWILEEEILAHRSGAAGSGV